MSDPHDHIKIAKHPKKEYKNNQHILKVQKKKKRKRKNNIYIYTYRQMEREREDNPRKQK